MKAKAKAGGKSKVTFDTRKRARMPFQPFRFEKWTDDDLNPPLVTMAGKIAEFEETARRETELSAKDKADGKTKDARYFAAMAKASRAKAVKWRKLSSLPKAEGLSLDLNIWNDLHDGVDFLLARAHDNELAAPILSFIVDHAMKGLLALAAHGNAGAAMNLIDSLVIAVRRFECLASHRPECFTHYTRRIALIPATISPQSGNAEECQDLMDKLEVGVKSIFSVRGKGKRRWTQEAPANDLAVRLVSYIDNRRFEYRLFATHLEVFDDCPQWFPKLASLADFGKATWPAWAEVAWEILDNGKHPALYERGTQICNPSKRGGDDSRFWLGDVKKALRDAFRTIANGRARRKKAGDTPPNVP